MQRGCMQRNSRKEGPDVWQFRWSEASIDGKRLYHKKIVGTIEQYADEDAARNAVAGLRIGNQRRWPTNEFRRNDRCSTL
jgi:integrase